MTVPVLTFFNNKGGVGKTSLVYHLAWMLSELGHRILVCDLDPQANLTAAFLSEEKLDKLWNLDADDPKHGETIMACLRPLVGVGDLKTPLLEEISSSLKLIPGDLALAGFEDELSTVWPKSLEAHDQYRAFRILTAFATVMQKGAAEMNADIILADIGPNLGAINRSALIATDCIVVPLAADLFSLQGLRNLGPTLDRWRKGWQDRKQRWEQHEFPLPEGGMRPIGYVLQQHSVRLDRPVKAYDKWINRMPEEYARNLLKIDSAFYPASPSEDAENALATIKHYRSLVPMAQEVRKPLFQLTSADGAIGSHAAAVTSAREDFKKLAKKIIAKIDMSEEEQ